MPQKRDKTPRTDYAGLAEHWELELAEADAEAIRRLRYVFSDLDEFALAAMAARHPDTARTVRYCRRRIAYNRRMMRRR